MHNTSKLDGVIGQRMHIAYTLRRVPAQRLQYLITGARPKAGDLVLARIAALGHHRNLQRPDRSRKRLFVGDYVVVAYANRYASSQFEAVVPKDLGPCQLIAGGGCAGQVLNRHARIRRGATQIEPVGLLTDSPHSAPLNLADFAIPQHTAAMGRTPTIAVVGSAMDSGKTTTAAYLARGLHLAGMKVGYAKVTGTGASGDPGLLLDAGAAEVVDFTDAGYASTYKLSLPECQAILTDLVGCLQARGCDAIIVEVADGMLQGETAELLQSRVFRAFVDSTLLASCDAMSAQCGVRELKRFGVPCLALCGAMEASPLQRREAVEATGLPFLGIDLLATPDIATGLLGCRAALRAPLASAAVA